MLKRFLTGLIIIAITVGFFALRYVSPYIFDFYLGVLTILATFEVSKAYKNGQKRNDLYFIMAYPILSYVALVLCVVKSVNILIYVAILLSLLVVIFAVSLLMNLLLKNKMNKEMIEVNYIGTHRKYALRKSVLNLFIMVYPALILMQMFVLSHLSGFSNFTGMSGKNIEVFLLIMAFVTTIITDTGAYLIGSGISGKKLCPKISPNKTISGAIGGVILAITFSVLLFLLFSSVGYTVTFQSYGINIIHFIIYGLIVSIFTQSGDILASYVKRRNDIKDYGNLLPGHGGVMDRVDGLMFSIFATLILGIIIFM